jgi:hypothetical protein
MYVHHPKEEENNYPSRIGDELSVSESLPFSPANTLTFLRPGQDEVLKFVKAKEPISAAQYACWHRIVLEQLQCNKDSSRTTKVDFELAIDCFRKIQRVHHFSGG